MLYYLKLHKNWQSVLTLSSSHVALTLMSPKLSSKHTWHTSHHADWPHYFPGFLHPIFGQWHWYPHNVDIENIINILLKHSNWQKREFPWWGNVDINNSLIHGSWFRKEVLSYQFIASKSLIIIPNFSISLHQCILFYYVQLILAQFLCYVMFYSFLIMFGKC